MKCSGEKKCDDTTSKTETKNSLKQKSSGTQRVYIVLSKTEMVTLPKQITAERIVEDVMLINK